MTLQDFESKFFSRPTIPEPTAIYVFDDEDSADNWILEKSFGQKNGDYSFVCVVQSDMQMRYTMKDEWCKAEVQQFYAVAPDTMVVVVKKVQVKHHEDD